MRNPLRMYERASLRDLKGTFEVHDRSTHGRSLLMNRRYESMSGI